MTLRLSALRGLHPCDGRCYDGYLFWRNGEMRHGRLPRLRRPLVAIAICAMLVLVAIVWYGGALSAPKQQRVGAAPRDLAAQVVRIPRANATPIAGWFVAGESGRAGVLLLHGVRSDRRQMLDRARFLKRAGYSVLLIDLQAHGETSGEFISFGVLESHDARAALEYLRARLHGQRVGVIGVSLGGAAALLGKASLQADAIVLEAVFSTIDEAIQNRMAQRFGALGHYLSNLLLWQIELRLGVSVAALSPLSAIGRLRAPVLIMSGSDDRRTRIGETEALFDAAPEPKSLWIVNGAVHENLHAFTPDEYERRVLAFFKQHLDAPDSRYSAVKARPVRLAKGTSAQPGNAIDSRTVASTSVPRR